MSVDPIGGALEKFGGLMRTVRDRAARVRAWSNTKAALSGLELIGFSWCFPSCSESPMALVSERLSQGMAAIGLTRMTRFFITHH